jgi:ubiquitin-protein ligase
MDKDELNGIMEYEFKRVHESGILEFGISIEHPEDNYTEWYITMNAPEDSDYKGGKYIVNVKFNKDYPLENPKFIFKTDIYHCNVNKNKI